MEIIAAQILLTFALLVGDLIAVIGERQMRSKPTRSGTGPAYMSSTRIPVPFPSALLNAKAEAPSCPT